MEGGPQSRCSCRDSWTLWRKDTSIRQGTDLGHTQPLPLTLGRSLQLSQMILIFLAFPLTSAHPKSLPRPPASPSPARHGRALLQPLYPVLSLWPALGWCSPGVVPTLFSHYILTWANSLLP